MVKRKMTNKKPLIVTLAVVLFIIAIASAAWFIYSNSVVSHMKSIAHQFTPDSSWQLESEHSVPPTPFCLHDEPCPYYTESWKISKTLTSSEFAQAISKSVSQYTPKIDCSLDPNLVGRSTTCIADYSIDGYRIEIRVDTTRQPRTSDTVTLSMWNGNN